VAWVALSNLAEVYVFLFEEELPFSVCHVEPLLVRQGISNSFLVFLCQPDVNRVKGLVSDGLL
jgi:hypothetical protein